MSHSGTIASRRAAQTTTIAARRPGIPMDGHSGDVMHHETRGDGEESPAVHLSNREQECLVWVARGKSSWDISKILGVSENTVNFHLKNIFRKLETNSRTAAAIKAVQLGLIRV